jgi:hypothetical protein
MKKLIRLSVVVLAIVFTSCNDDEEPMPENPANMPYEIVINPSDFVSTNIIGNNFFPLVSGVTTIHEGKDDDGAAVRVEVNYTNDTKTILGVTCVVVRDQAFVNNVLIEDTYDWYAQDNDGNVWYFGEDTKEFEKGAVVSTEGSWEGGVNGALPGIIMFAKPQVGVWYRQEYSKGEAEDVAQILSRAVTVTVPYGTFNNCLQVAEWNALEPGIVEQKFYAPGVGVIRTVTVKGGNDYEDLVSVN